MIWHRKKASRIGAITDSAYANRPVSQASTKICLLFRILLSTTHSFTFYRVVPFWLLISSIPHRHWNFNKIFVNFIYVNILRIFYWFYRIGYIGRKLNEEADRAVAESDKICAIYSDRNGYSEGFRLPLWREWMEWGISVPGMFKREYKFGLFEWVA